MKKLCVLFLTLVIALSTFIPMQAIAASNSISPRYMYIVTTGVGISIDEKTGVANCNASCVSVAGYTVEVECKLQRYMGSYWGTLKTWTSSGEQAAMTNNYWAVYKGYTYRAYATYRVYNAAGDLLESVSYTDTYSYY